MQKMEKLKERAIYVAPSIEVLEMEHEGGVMNSSLKPFEEGGSATMINPYQGGGIRYNSSSATDLEELINDILTIKE